MKRILYLTTLVAILVSSCKKDSATPESGGIPANYPRTAVPAELQANWMYGNFSTTEYWSQNPANYLGNALEYAIAFNFEEKGEYTQYFTASSVSAGVKTYQQSVTKGTVEVDPGNKVIKTHAYSSHYKRTKNGQVEEERDMRPEELAGVSTYYYTVVVEPNGSRALQLKLEGSASHLKFYQK